MNPAIQSPPLFKLGSLLRLWLALLAGAVVYCKLSQYTSHHAPASMAVALWWNVKVFAVWLFVSVAVTTEHGRAAAARIWNRPALRATAFVLLPAAALVYEWAAGSALSEVGWLGEEASIWKVLYKRVPLYATALGALWYFGQRLRVSVALPDVPARIPTEHSLTVTTLRGPVSIAIGTIEVIVAAENYVEICLADGTQYLHRATLTSMSQSLGPAGFVRIHRSILVNTHHVAERLSQRRLRLRSGRIVRVGRAFAMPASARIPR
jgi:DNA-binding LytR/AlgR family response regulator